MRITASWSRSRWDLPNTSMWRDAQRPIGGLPSNRPSTDVPDTGSQVKNLAVDGKHPIQIVCHGPALAGFERQARLGSVESLDLRLLVDGQHDGMCRRAHIEADDVLDLLGESGVLGALEGSQSVRLQPMRLPDALDRAQREAHGSGHRAPSPMGRLSRW